MVTCTDLYSYYTAGNISGAATCTFLLFNPIMCLVSILVLQLYTGADWCKKFYFTGMLVEEISGWLGLVSAMRFCDKCAANDQYYQSVLFALTVCSSVKTLGIALYVTMIFSNLCYSKDATFLAVPFLLTSWSTPLVFCLLPGIVSGIAPQIGTCRYHCEADDQSYFFLMNGLLLLLNVTLTSLVSNGPSENAKYWRLPCGVA